MLIATGPFASGMHLLTESSDTLKNELSVLDEQLSHLPNPTPNSTPWTMGFRTAALPKHHAPQTIDVTFDQPAAVDLIIIMPSAYAHDGNQLKILGFPEHFYIERVRVDGSAEIIVDYRDTVYEPYGLEPQLFPCPDATPIAGFRVTITQAPLIQVVGRQQYMACINELFAFEGIHNVALNAEVKSTVGKWTQNVWDKKCVVDGFFLFTPTDVNYQQLGRRLRFFSDKATLLFDLGTEKVVDEIRIWPSLGATDFDHPFSAGTGFPSEFALQVLQTPDDSHPSTIYKYKSRFLRPGASPFMHRVSPTQGRYFKLILRNGFPDFRTDIPNKIILNEVELAQKGQVLTRGVPIAIDVINPHRTRNADKPEWLNDGLIGNGKIKPLRRWLEKFHLRRQLERQHLAVETALEKALSKEEERTRILAIGGSALILLLALMVWVSRLLSEQRWSRMREQIACDLHDELGANVSSIAHSSEMAKELIEQNQPDLLNRLLDHIIEAARLTADETRNFIQFLEGRDTGVELPGQINAMARKILGNIDYTCTFHATRPFSHLNPTRKWDLLFFVKEALNNILKHSGADHVDIVTLKTGRDVQLVITDNGCGIAVDHIPPRHLKCRAKRLNGELIIESTSNQGTQIKLTFKKGKHHE